MKYVCMYIPVIAETAEIGPWNEKYIAFFGCFIIQNDI